MGVLNVTPDSFSDGGEHAGHEAAIAHGMRLLAEGADVLDVGGESTRPGSERITPAEEQRRILPVVEALAAAGAVLSVDTLHAATAAAVLDAGAHLVNDVSGLSVTPAMVEVVAERQAPYVLTHARGTPATMDGLADYDDVVDEVLAELETLRDRLVAAGVAPERIVLDPGLGFAKRGAQNWALLRALPRFTATGHRVLVGASRKRFLGALLETDGEARPAAGRDTASAAVSALSAHAGAWAVRVHDVRASADAVAVAHAWLGTEPAVLRPGAARRPRPGEGPDEPPAPRGGRGRALRAGDRAGRQHVPAAPPRVPDRRDRINLLGIGAVGYHGVLDQEKRSGQPFFVDLVMYLDLSRAGAEDDVALTAHYGEVAEEVRDMVIGPSVNLLETLADRIARRLLERFPLEAVEVTVHKPKAPIEVTFSDVSVTIYRER
ncbi:hypothetical protein BJF77_15925 [Kocuria sp. CNJ-770]|nr:hypothetical protein BJF77_15925 [Kocuria sp. CNJ-770]